ncbi:MAG: hypothetical protein IKT46_05915 [Clostridia bacterium]|nr:hypothetical protein [Clostridia bacterium]
MGYNNYRSLLSYRYGQLKENGLWNIAVHAVRYTRRYFFISRLIRYASLVIAAVETSAVLIIVFSVLLAILPISLIFFGITALLSISRYKRYNELIPPEINQNKTVIIDAKRGYFGRDAYLNNMAKCFRDEGYTVIVISRSFKRDRFLVAKKAEENIWVVKLNYFFILKKQLTTDDLTYIY